MNRAETLAWIEDVLQQGSVLSEPESTPPILTRSAVSPTCGDRIELALHRGPDGGVRLRGRVSGCTLSTAAAATGARAVEGRQPLPARALLDSAVARRFDVDGTDRPGDTDLDRLAGLALVPLRRRCVAFGWQQMVALLDAAGGPPADVEIVPPDR